jgi:hypothetical protein
MKESGGTYSDVSLLGGDPKVAPGPGIDVIRSISLNDTDDFTIPCICAGNAFFFCEPPFGWGKGAGAAGEANVGATFDSFIIACTIGFCDSK